MKPRDPEKTFVLTKGSKYRILSAESREKPLETVGIFKGFTSVGHDEAFVVELDESHGAKAGRTRIIPLHMVLAIDVLEVVEEEEETTQPEKMFG